MTADIQSVRPDQDEDEALSATDRLKAAIDAAEDGRISDLSDMPHPLAGPVMRLIERSVGQNRDRLASNVALSMDLNEIAISSAHVLKSNRDIDSGAQGISAAAEELSASIGEIAGSVQTASDMTRDIGQASDAGAARSREAMDSMEDIAGRATEVSQRIEALSEASVTIGDIVGTIDDIATKTNLLALNATIEAARAGEAGKGFAVVANEVKALSAQTARATQDIRQRIDALREDISGIVEAMAANSKSVETGRGSISAVADSMTTIHEQVSGLEGRMTEISGILDQQTAAAQEVSEGIASIGSQTTEAVQKVDSAMAVIDRSVDAASKRLEALATLDIDHKTPLLAKADHVIRKKQLLDMLAGRCAISADDIADHRACRLGRWYYGADGEALRGYAAFKALEAPHRAFHTEGLEVVRRYEAGDIAGAFTQMARVEEASRQVLDAIDSLLKQAAA